MKSNSHNVLALSALFIALFIMLLPDIAEARGGSFGGSRGGGGFRGGGRSFSSPRSSPTKSFGGTRSTGGRIGSSSPSVGKSSFGGSRMSNNSQYTSRYGAPRQSTPMTRTGANGMQQNYVVHNYGGYGSGLMTGYMLGHSSWMWGMPFHPAYYYSRPYEVVGANGVVEVYPPTFSFGQFFFTMLIMGLVIWLIIRIFKSRKSSNNGYGSQSSFN
ncbi:MAG: hypothetical protein NTW25_11335 [Candidatus Kapabacteria bacterium]|nr:hypothetical protein [Candidatus Kapabacteria bacterium]